MIEAAWLVFVIASLVLIATPGQDMILVMSRSIAQGVKAGVVTAAGVSIGLVGHTVLATLGLGFSLNAQETKPLPIKLSLKYNMVKFDADLAKSFAMLKEIGYDGVELDSPGGQDKKAALAASKSTGLPIHG
jgi:hypothetical protein